MSEITVEKIYEAKKNCVEDSRCDECACHMKNDCRLNHLNDAEKKLLDAKEMGS